MQLNYQATQDFLMRELRLMTAPVAIKYFFDEQELAAFRSRASHYVPVKPITFCQAEIGARMEGLAVLVEAKKLGCSNARFVFGWKEFDEAEVKSHIKYCRDMDQANRFVQGKPRLQGESPLLAVAVAPWKQLHISLILFIFIVITCKPITSSATGWPARTCTPSGPPFP